MKAGSRRGHRICGANFAGALLLGIVAASGAVRRILLTAAVIEPMRCFLCALTDDCLPSRGDAAAPHAETSGVSPGLVTLVGIRSATVTNIRADSAQIMSGFSSAAQSAACNIQSQHR